MKNVPGRKTDVEDCPWLQYLHTVGLLRASFRPEQDVCNVRSILRHRDSLVQMASVHIQYMQKALDQMNLQIHHVISDITGLTGTAIIDAILQGERDPLADRRMTERSMNRLLMSYLERLPGSMQEVELPSGEKLYRCIYSPHSLRATTATLLLDVGHPIESVQELLDHKHITTTQIYDKRRRSVRDSASHKTSFGMP